MANAARTLACTMDDEAPGTGDPSTEPTFPPTDTLARLRQARLSEAHSMLLVQALHRHQDATDEEE